MTNYEKIKNMSVEEMAKFLCESFIVCSDCPVRDSCVRDHEGFSYWLESEVEEE